MVKNVELSILSSKIITIALQRSLQWSCGFTVCFSKIERNIFSECVFIQAFISIDSLNLSAVNFWVEVALVNGIDLAD